MFKYLALLVAIFSTSVAFSAVVDFEIRNGTASGMWNTMEETVQVQVGDTLRITNNDTVMHRLHTNGRPCGHGPDIKPGMTWNCQIRAAYDVSAEGPLYDHYYGEDAAFWVNAIPQ